MSIAIIITLSILLLLAYVFDITSSKTKIPSVILLLILGFFVKQVSSSLGQVIPDLNPILPVLGTIGLILIVLEGSLELEINRAKLPLIYKSSLVALIPLLVISFGIAFYLNYYQFIPFKLALENAIPIGIISSAIAIPSAKNLLSNQREFITYESSLSDIFGVIFFNFVTLNDYFGTHTFGNFALEIIIMLLISLTATLLLAGFLNKIKHHIKFIPMLIFVLLIYMITKVYHLPSLLFILIFGLFIGNIEQMRHIKLIQLFHPINFSKDVHKFKEITTELAFLTRALFFILFGFLIELKDVLNSKTIILAASITTGIFVVRYIVLKLSKVPTDPMVFIAPRGLITILLFLSIPISHQIIPIDKSLITQIIILSSLFMMIGLLRYKKPKTILTQESPVKNH